MFIGVFCTCGCGSGLAVRYQTWPLHYLGVSKSEGPFLGVCIMGIIICGIDFGVSKSEAGFLGMLVMGIIVYWRRF